jgi:hypothetical protein
VARHRFIHDDYPILPTFPIPPVVHGAGYEDYGLALGTTRPAEAAGAYHIEPVIRDEADLAKLHPRPVRIDHETTRRTCERAADLFGDLLEVRLAGRTHWRYGLTRVLVHLRGLDQLFLDLYDHPDLIHRLMAFLSDDFLAELDLFAREGAIGWNSGPDQVTGSGGLCPTRDLPGPVLTGPRQARDCVCWGESQETGVVGPEQFAEFVLAYQLPLLSRFGLVDYGCCEPLDRKLDLLIDRLPNLRWVAVQRWADRALAAERLGRRYVYVYKPNPAPVCVPTPDWDEAERDLRETLALTRGCAVHLVLKDTHTFCQQPERLTRWTDLASRLARCT